MKQFLKFTLATITGIIITSFLGMLILFGIIGAIAASSEKMVKTMPGSVYELKLTGQLVERSKDDLFSSLMPGTLSQSAKSIGLDDILSNIKKAKNDDNILGIYLNGGMLSGGYASIKEVRDALEDFKTSGKFIVAYADEYSQKNYYLASVADKIYLNPSGIIEWQGIAANTTFYKNTLDKLGVEVQVVKVGTFKSAVEPYIQTKMSDANKEQVNVYISSIWNNTLSAVAESRKLSIKQLNQYADENLTFAPVETYLAYKLVDSLTYADGMKEVLKTLTHTEEAKDVKLLSHSKMNSVIISEKIQKEKIAIIYGVGSIDMLGETDGIISEDLVKIINKVKEEKSVKAVVFRINSGGGSAYGSEQIWHAVSQLKKEKPVIVSMGDYAASGGYYIACNADSILAQPNTLTGSIGIFGRIPNIEGLNKKIGLTYDGVKTNKFSDAITLNRAFSPEERNMMQNMINRGYELFTKRCAEGRNMQIDSLKAIAEGRVWTGLDAQRLGLVDELGGLNDAINIAAEKAGLENFSIKSYPEKEDFITTLMKDFSEGVEARMMKSTLGNENYRILKQIEQAKEMNGIFALLPFNISLN